MDTVNYKISVVNGNSTDTYHPETNSGQVYDFDNSAWLSSIVGVLSTLSTTQKTSLVAAINEIVANTTALTTHATDYSQHKNDVIKKHIEIVNTIPASLTGHGVFFKRETTAPDVPEKFLVSEVYDKLASFITEVKSITSTNNIMRNGVTNVVVIDKETVEFTTNTTWGHLGLSLPSDSSKKYIAVFKISNIGSVTSRGIRFRLGYSTSPNSGVSQNGADLQTTQDIEVGASRVVVHPYTINTTLPFATLGFSTSANGVKIRLSQQVYDVTNLSEDQINIINWADIRDEKIIRADYSIKSQSANTINYRGSSWQGKTWLTIGDSITSTGIYQSLVKNALGFGTINNKGIAGAGMSTMLSNTTNAEIISADLITFYGAFNHFYPNAPTIGSINDTPAINGTTFLSQLKYLIESILRIKPTANLVIIGTHNGADSYRPPLYAPIRDGFNIGDYVEAMGKLARYYGLPFIDLYGKSGINGFNLSTYTSDGLHLTSEGNRRIAQIIAGELQRIEPIN